MSMQEENYYDLGSYVRPVSTSDGEAQKWFTRGLIWSYGFNHEESAVCFQKAIDHDEKCAMAYWGLAYALGPNYNKPWDSFDGDELQKTVERTHEAAEQARQHAGSATAIERALIGALQFRYPQSGVDDERKDWSIWNREYANSMRFVYQTFKQDLDVTTLFADALMNLAPWKLWNLKTGKPALGSPTVELQAIFNHAFTLDGALKHPGLLHLYIHFMELCPTPELALPVADQLRGLVPDAGHLQHMPTHLDVLCGDYRRAVASNSDAIAADEKFLARAGSLNFYTLYRCHDYHFKIYAAMFAGQSRVALETVAQLEASISEELLRVKSPPMADWLEGFLAMRVHVLIRFGRWQQILDLPVPHNKELYCATIAMTHYAKGVALAAIGRMKEADEARRRFHAARKDVPGSRTLFNNKCVKLLAVAEAMLDAECEYRRGAIEVAFEKLDLAVSREDNLPYDEPWGWMQPTRHAYGALLLEQGRVHEAAAKYRADLGLDPTLPRALRHPNNVWALHGYHECLKRLGRDAEAEIIGHQLKLAKAVADIEIKTSCFCRRSTNKL